MKCYLLLPMLLAQVMCDNMVPSSPEIFYGGFLPILRQVDTESTEHSDILPEERKSRQIPDFEEMRNSRVYRFKEGVSRNHLKETFFSQKTFPLHKEKSPQFPLGTWYSSFLAR